MTENPDPGREAAEGQAPQPGSAKATQQPDEAGDETQQGTGPSVDTRSTD